jgi:hypothetical protein
MREVTRQLTRGVVTSECSDSLEDFGLVQSKRTQSVPDGDVGAVNRQAKRKEKRYEDDPSLVSNFLGRVLG